jgi:hypothetical protein
MNVFIALRGVEGRGSLDELACQKRTAAESAEDTPGLQLRVGALAGSAQLGVGGVGGLL